MQEGRKCIFVNLHKKQLCAQISFVFYCFLTSYFFHKNVNTLSWDLLYSLKYGILPVLLSSVKISISTKMSLTTFLHSRDDLSLHFCGGKVTGFFSFKSKFLRYLSLSNAIWFYGKSSKIDIYPSKNFLKTTDFSSQFHVFYRKIT